MDPRNTIREFVRAELAQRYGGQPVDFRDSDSILLSKLADSLFFVDLMLFLESRFNLNVSLSAISKSDLDTIDKMVSLVEGK